MIGCGSPVALQFSLTVELNIDTILEGGLDVNRGRDTTTNMVFFSAFPRRFFAEQVYMSESSLRTCEICSAPLLYLTLHRGNWLDNFLHVTTGVGYPVTWQIGRVKVLPSIAWRGPGLREMRGWTETRKRRNSSKRLRLQSLSTSLLRKYVVWVCKILRTAHVSCVLLNKIPRNFKIKIKNNNHWQLVCDYHNWADHVVLIIIYKKRRHFTTCKNCNREQSKQMQIGKRILARFA